MVSAVEDPPLPLSKMQRSRIYANAISDLDSHGGERKMKMTEQKKQRLEEGLEGRERE